MERYFYNPGWRVGSQLSRDWEAPSCCVTSHRYMTLRKEFAAVASIGYCTSQGYQYVTHVSFVRTWIAQCVRDQLVKKPMFTPVGNINVNRLLLWKFESVAKSQRKQLQFTVNETLRPHKTDRFWQLAELPISCAWGNIFTCFEHTFEITQPKRYLKWIDLV